MGIHKFGVQITKGDGTYVEYKQIQTIDIMSLSYGNGDIIGSGYSYRQLGALLHDTNADWSYMTYFSTMIFDNVSGSPGDSYQMSKVTSMLTSIECPLGETRIIWFGGVDLTYTKDIPRIEIRAYESSGYFFDFVYKIKSKTYYSCTLRNYMVYIPWRNINKTGIIIPGNTFHNYTPPQPPSQENPMGVPSSTQLSAFSGSVDVITEDANTWFDAAEGYDLGEDPYGGGGYSENIDNDEGNFSDNSDVVTDDNLPSIDVLGTGFATIFAPTKNQLQQLSDVFWNNDIFSALQNLVQNIQDMFTSLAMVPFTVETGASPEVTWLGLPLTSIYLRLCTKQYYEFSMGSIDLSADSRIYTSGSALDYSPFSKIGIYLPFIGYQELDIDEVRGSIISLKYRIDILSGAAVAIIYVNGNAIYQFTGNCLTQIPITNENMQSLVTDAVNVGIAAAAVKTAGAASSAEGAMIDADEKMTTAQKEAHKAHTRIRQTNADTHLVSATANSMMGLKPQYNKSSSVSSAASMLSVKQPYLFLTTPRQCLPKNYRRYGGYPSNTTGKLNEYSGFTVVESIRLNGLVATTPEVEEIYNLLRGGVII